MTLRTVRAIRDVMLFIVGMGTCVWQAAFTPASGINLPLFISGAACAAAPLLRPDPPMPRGKASCVCRGCRRPGQRYVWERLLRKPRWAVPASHAEASLGIEHGRLHDLRRKEAEAGVMHSAEVIQHFALPEDRWIEEPDAIWDHWAGGCHDDPNLTVTVWG